MPSNSGRIGPSYFPPVWSLSLWPIFRVVLLQRDEQKEGFSEKAHNPLLVFSRVCIPAPCPHSCSHECKKALFWPPPKTRVGSTDWAWGCIWNSACSSWIIQEGRKRRFVFPLNLATCMPPGGQKIELKLMSVASTGNSENQRYTLANTHWNNAT